MCEDSMKNSLSNMAQSVRRKKKLFYFLLCQDIQLHTDDKKKYASGSNIMLFFFSFI